MTKNRKYKNPHAMSLKKRQDLQKEGYKGHLKIRETERLSERPFGRHTRKGKFIFDIDRVPFFNIPDLNGFKVSLRTLTFLYSSNLMFHTQLLELTPKRKLNARFSFQKRF